MVLINLGIGILLIGLIIALSMKFFWLVSIIFLYRFITYFITYEWVSTAIGVDNHFFYFLAMLALSFGVHYLIIRLTYDLQWLKYVFLFVVVAWVFLVYDFLEIFLLKDWLQANGLWGAEDFKTSIKELFSTSPEQFKGYFIDALNTLNEFFDSVFGAFRGTK